MSAIRHRVTRLLCPPRQQAPLDEPFGNFSRYRNKNNFIAFGSLDGTLRFPMLRLAMAVAALLLAATYAQAQTAKHSFSGLCAYYPGRGGGLTAAHKTLPFGTRVRVTTQNWSQRNRSYQ